MAGWSQAMMPMRFAPGSIDNAFHNWVLRLQAEWSPHAVAGIADFIRTQDLTSELTAIAAPALIMAGDRSPFVDHSLALDLHQGLSGSEIRRILASVMASFSAGPRTALKPLSNSWADAYGVHRDNTQHGRAGKSSTCNVLLAVRADR
jgi:pimeloyl-ACP methyl ester carboxylesterase